MVFVGVGIPVDQDELEIESLFLPVYTRIVVDVEHIVYSHTDRRCISPVLIRLINYLGHDKDEYVESFKYLESKKMKKV